MQREQVDTGHQERVNQRSMTHCLTEADWSARRRSNRRPCAIDRSATPNDPPDRLETVGDHVQVHVLPTGKTPGRFNDLTKLRYSNDRAIQAHIDAAERATLDFLATSIDR